VVLVVRLLSAAVLLHLLMRLVLEAMLFWRVVLLLAARAVQFS